LSVPGGVTPLNSARKPSSAAGAGGLNKGKMASTLSVSLRFRTQLDSLMASLRSTRAFYIKCIKPNSLKKKGVFEGTLVLTQLRYSGQ
jgi:myosin heavy subunit